MTNDAIQRAREFVNDAILPEPPTAVLRAGTPPFDPAKEGAAVVGSDIVSFVTDVTPEQRQDVVNATLFAQLVAGKKYPTPRTIEEVTGWYESYFDVLSRVGFITEKKGLSEYTERTEDFQAHQAIIEVASAMLAGSPAALVVVKKTLDALKKVADDSPWITLFDRASRSANTARVQCSLVHGDEDGRFLVSLVAFGLEASSAVTQVLFFRFRSNTVKLRHHSSAVSINMAILASVRGQIAAKLQTHASRFVAGLEI